MNTKEDYPTDGFGTVVCGSECILPAPGLGGVWQKGQDPFRRPDTRDLPHVGRKRTKARPNGRVKGIPTEGRFEASSRERP